MSGCEENCCWLAVLFLGSQADQLQNCGKASCCLGTEDSPQVMMVLRRDLDGRLKPRNSSATPSSHILTEAAEVARHSEHMAKGLHLQVGLTQQEGGQRWGQYFDDP